MDPRTPQAFNLFVKTHHDSIYFYWTIVKNSGIQGPVQGPSKADLARLVNIFIISTRRAIAFSGSFWACAARVGRKTRASQAAKTHYPAGP